MDILKTILQHQIPLLSEAELSEFLSLWTIERQLKRQEYLYGHGREQMHLYFIRKGAFKIFHETDDLKELIVGFGYMHTLLLDLPSFVAGLASIYRIQALRKSELIGIHKRDFYGFMERCPPLATYWRQQMELALLNRLEREIDILMESPQKRYERVLERSPILFQEIPHKFIAAYLRMTPETLSRLKRS